MSAIMVTAAALEGRDGQFVDLLATGRTIKQVSGLAALQAREVIEPKPGRHGVNNRSRYRDSVPITIVGELFGDDADDAWAQYNQLAAALAAAVDTNRELRWSGGTILDLVKTDVHLVSFDGPVEIDRDVIRYQLILRPNDPRSFAQAVQSAVGDTLSASGGGATFPLGFPVIWNPAGGGSAVFTVGGTDETPPVLRIYGYCTAPTIRLVSTGEQIVLTGEIGAGRYVDVDIAAREILLDDGSPRLNLLDFAQSTWFEIPPGPQTVQLLASNFDGAAHLEVMWSNAYA